MKYRTSQFRKAWNAAAKKDHRLSCTASELRQMMTDRHQIDGHRYMEMQSWQSKNGTTQTIEF